MYRQGISWQRGWCEEPQTLCPHPSSDPVLLSLKKISQAGGINRFMTWRHNSMGAEIVLVLIFVLLEASWAMHKL